MTPTKKQLVVSFEGKPRFTPKTLGHSLLLTSKFFFLSMAAGQLGHV